MTRRLDVGLVDGGIFRRGCAVNMLLLRYMPLKFPGKVFLIMPQPNCGVAADVD